MTDVNIKKDIVVPDHAVWLTDYIACEVDEKILHITGGPPIKSQEDVDVLMQTIYTAWHEKGLPVDLCPVEMVDDDESGD
jgi:hypothetical protein